MTPKWLSKYECVKLSIEVYDKVETFDKCNTTLQMRREE